MSPADATTAAVRTFLAEARVDLDTAAREAGRAVERAREGGAAPTPAQAVLVGWHLNRFFSAVESLHERVARTFDGQVPAGDRWHAELLDRMALDLAEIRPAVLSEKTRAALSLYLDFRHVFRRIYRADLEFPPMEHLVRALPHVAGAWKNDVEAFLRFVDATLAHARAK